MTKREAIKILRQHNEWRRGGDGEHANPTKIGIAIDTAIRLLSTKRKPISAKSVGTKRKAK
jgi:hypothetical protein